LVIGVPLPLTDNPTLLFLYHTRLKPAVIASFSVIVDAMKDSAVLIGLANYYSKALWKSKGLQTLLTKFLRFKDFTALWGRQPRLGDSCNCTVKGRAQVCGHRWEQKGHYEKATPRVSIMRLAALRLWMKSWERAYSTPPARLMAHTFCTTNAPQAGVVVWLCGGREWYPRDVPVLEDGKEKTR
jgi:hypothetical protein